MITEYLQSLFLIFAAEMGDKTQILAMMFATQFKISKVFIGIFIGSLLNHGLAVAFGSYMGGMIPSYILQMIAGTAFIGFAIWTLRESDEEEEETSSSQQFYGAVITVALAFFVGELGDKTQLTAITLAVDAAFPIIVLMGTVSGMLVTSGIGIVIGSQLGDKIPDVFIKIASGTVFMIFGIIKLYYATPSNYINPYTVTIFIGAIGFGIFLLIKRIFEIKKSGQVSAYKKAAKHLYDYAQTMKKSVDEICRGVNHCGQCQGSLCPIGFIRTLTDDLMKDKKINNDDVLRKEIQYYKNKFDRVKLVHSLEMTCRYLAKQDSKSIGYQKIDNIRKVIEMILFDKTFPFKEDKEHYTKSVSDLMSIPFRI